MSILVLKSGVLTTVQDLGRNNFRNAGINPNGAMDKQAARICNLLLGNRENVGVLEMHFPAAELLFEKPAIVALGGANFDARLTKNLGADDSGGKSSANQSKPENWRATFVEQNTVLSFARRQSGARVYLAVKNGFAVNDWLGSQSTNLIAGVGGFQGRALRANDRLFFADANNAPVKPRLNVRAAPDLIPVYSDFPTIRLTRGAESHLLTDASRTILQTASFAVRSESNRMGFRLRGEKIELREKVEIVSSAVAFGTVQLLPDGQLVILMADHQTSGGYPRIGNVLTIDLPVLAQLNANDRVYFELIELAAAENLLLAAERKLAWLRAASRFL